MSTARDPLAGFDFQGVVGPTASGKSALALALAERHGFELVSLDSMQVYRGMDVGTAKPSAEERARVRHHMLDLVEPSERYDVQRFLRDLEAVLVEMRSRNARPLFVGGTGFYLKVLLAGLFEGPDVDPALRASLEADARERGSPALHAELVALDPDSARRLHPNDAKRVIRALEVLRQTGRKLSDWQREWSAPSPRAERARLVGLGWPVDVLDARIAERTRAMLAAGWPDEAARVRATCGFGPTAVQALGYREALAVHDGAIDADRAAREIAAATRQFARRQRTWYRHFSITWLPTTARERAEGGLVAPSVVEAALRVLEAPRAPSGSISALPGRSTR